jgi:hypothetical protein
MRRVRLARMLGVITVVALPAFGFSYGSLSFGGKGIGIVRADDSNGDLNSNCHEGAKLLGAGGNDKIDSGDCVFNQ